MGIKSEDVDRFQKQREQNGVELDEHDLLPIALNKSKEKKEQKESPKEEIKPRLASPQPVAPKTTVEGATAQHSAPQLQETSLAV